MEITRIFLATFAVYRLALLLTEDDGPMFIFKRLRNFTGYMTGKQLLKGKEYGFWVWLNEGLGCPFCVGLWAAIGCALLVIYPTFAGDIFLLVFALAGAQSMLQRLAK